MNIIFLLFLLFFCLIITSRLFHRKSFQDSNALSIKMRISKKPSKSLIPHSRAFKYFQYHGKPCREQLHVKNIANGITIADSVKNNGVLVISLSPALMVDTTLKPPNSFWRARMADHDPTSHPSLSLFTKNSFNFCKTTGTDTFLLTNSN